jgi:hypothetical protein
VRRKIIHSIIWNSKASSHKASMVAAPLWSEISEPTRLSRAITGKVTCTSR